MLLPLPCVSSPYFAYFTRALADKPGNELALATGIAFTRAEFGSNAASIEAGRLMLHRLQLGHC
jgi:hypothetical protein